MGVEIFDKRVSNDKYSKMKLFWFLAALAIAEEVDDLGNKKNKVDKGPRECAGDKLSDSDDGSKLWKCRSRNPDNKNPHLTKRCKLKCKMARSAVVAVTLRSTATPERVGYSASPRLSSLQVTASRCQKFNHKKRMKL